MKTKKNKLTNFLKIGILFFGISLLLWNCEKEEIISNPNQSNLLSKLQSKFNAESFKKAIPYEFGVLWNNENKKYHKELEKYYYEFPINFTNSFNPNNFKSKSVSKYSTIYKFFVIENENQEHSFYIYKTFTENINKKTLKNKNILFVEEEEVLNGFNHILNNEGEIVYAEKIENGKKDENILFKKEFKKKKTKDNYQSRMMEDCYTETTYHYVDNYLVWKINGEPDQWVFAGSILTGTSVSQVCESYWLPDLNIGGGGNSDGYYTNPGNSPAYKDCQSSSNKNYQGRYVEEDNPCKYVITANPIECGEGYVYDATLGECVEITVENVPPDCESFDYSRVGTTNWQTAAVSGINELFTVFNWECTGFDFGILPQSIYFQLPINSQFTLDSGYTKTESAATLHEAFKAYDIWYKNNACSASYSQMTTKFLETIKEEFEEIGGNATVTPPLGYTGSISTYNYTWFGYGNCN